MEKIYIERIRINRPQYSIFGIRDDVLRYRQGIFSSQKEALQVIIREMIRHLQN